MGRIGENCDEEEEDDDSDEDVEDGGGWADAAVVVGKWQDSSKTAPEMSSGWSTLRRDDLSVFRRGSRCRSDSIEIPEELGAWKKCKLVRPVGS